MWLIEGESAVMRRYFFMAVHVKASCFLFTDGVNCLIKPSLVLAILPFGSCRRARHATKR